jgi:hypothetical protein
MAKGVSPSAHEEMMNKTFVSSAENVSPGNYPRDRHQNEVTNAIGSWKSQLAPNTFGLCNNQFPAGLFHRPAAGDEEARTMGGDPFRASQGMAN